MVVEDSRTSALERREQLLVVARTIFAERGYRATTMDDVAAAAGFTKPILYQHFSSKEALYNEIVQTAGARLIDGLAEVTKDRTTARQMVERAFEVFFSVVVNDSASFRLLFLQPHEGAQVSELRRIENRLTSLIEELLPTTSDPRARRQYAAAIVGLAEGAATAWLVQRENEGFPPVPDNEVVHLAERFAAMAWGGLRTLMP
jgi:AcrR family transcriptional regulator